MHIKKLVLSLALPLIALSVQAQYLGPNSQVANTVRAILDNPVDDQPVVLEGYLVKKVGKEKYIFSDATGEIRVEIDQDKFRFPVTEKTKVRLIGEIEKEFIKDVEIDVDRIEIVGENTSK